MTSVSVGRILTKLGRHSLDNVLSYFINSVVVIAELREVALCIKVNYITVFVTDRLYIGIFYGTERVSHYRQSRNAECHHSVNVCIVQSHLRLFVSVLVVHIVDNVHRIHIQLAQPLTVNIKSASYLVIVKLVAL